MLLSRFVRARHRFYLHDFAGAHGFSARALIGRVIGLNPAPPIVSTIPVTTDVLYYRLLAPVYAALPRHAKLVMLGDSITALAVSRRRVGPNRRAGSFPGRPGLASGSDRPGPYAMIMNGPAKSGALHLSAFRLIGTQCCCVSPPWAGDCRTVFAVTRRRPSGPGWIHEIKHDGFCIIARRAAAQGKVRKRP